MLGADAGGVHRNRTLSQPERSPARGTFSRRQVLLGGLVVAATPLVAACSGSSKTASSSPSTSPTAGATNAAGAAKADLTDVTYQLSWLTTSEFCGTYLADHRGYFAAQGQKLTMFPGGPSVAPEALIAQGKALIGTSKPDTIGAALAHGAPLQIFATRYRKSPFCMLSSTKNPVTKPSDLVGKIVGVPPSNDVQISTLLALNGIEKSKVHSVPISFDVTPLISGEVQAMTGFVTDEAISLKLAGFPVEVMMFSDFGYGIYGDCYFATSSTVANHPDTLVSFLKAEQRGWQDDIANPTSGTSITEQLYGATIKLSTQQQQLSNEAQLPLMGQGSGRGLFDMTQPEMEGNINTLAKGGTNVTSSELFTTSIVDSLYG
jgi:ABC-type nitrate/sulfonate/bicarbonate transport system substrate-binding protein